MNSEAKRILFESAQAIAELYGDDFVGRIEVNIFKGGVGSVQIVETLKPDGRQTSSAPSRESREASQ